MKRLGIMMMILAGCMGLMTAQTYRVGDVYTAPDGSKGMVFYILPEGTGGWVVALNDASPGCAWGTQVDVPGLGNQAPLYQQQLMSDTAGFAHTSILRAFQNSTAYAAGKVDFANGWYLPSPAQLRMLHAVMPMLAPSLAAAGGSDMAKARYWASAEQDAAYAWQVDFGSIVYHGLFRAALKNTQAHVRAVRSFTYEPAYAWSTGDTTPSITLTPEQTATYSVTVTSAAGCSDVAEQVVVVSPTYADTLSETVCDHFVWFGDTLVQSGEYTRELTSVNGCDSILTLMLTVIPYTHFQDLRTVCDSLQWIDGVTYYADNDTSIFVTTNAAGCDSVVALHLTVNHAQNSLISMTVVENDIPYYLNEVPYTSSGTYTQHLSTTAGCDSLLTLVLTVLENVTVSVDSTVCANLLPLVWNDSTFSSAATKTAVFTAANGADSIVVMNLQVLPKPVVHISGLTTLCGDSAVVLTADSAKSYLWNTGDTTRCLTVALPGVYSVAVTDDSGCVNTASTRVDTLENPIMQITIPEMCAGGSYTLSVGYHSNDNIQLQHGETTLFLTDTIFLPDGIYCEPYGCSYRSPLTFTAFADGDTIGSVEDIYYVKLNIEHSWIGDLYINITCPNGQKADLMKYGGSGSSSCNSSIPPGSRGWIPGNNMSTSVFLGQALDSSWQTCDASHSGNEQGVGWNYCWSENTTQGYVYAPGQGSLIYRAQHDHYGIVDSSNVAAGTQFYRPDDSFSNLIGCPLNGDWYIEVQDGWNADNGYIFGWELALSSEALPESVFVFDSASADGPWVINLSDSLFALTPPADLEHDTVIFYTFTVYDVGGCHFDTTVAITFHVPQHTSHQMDVCETYTWNGVTYTQTGTYSQTFTDANGCDSLVTLSLVVNSNKSAYDTLYLVQDQMPYHFLPSDTTLASGSFIQFTYILPTAAGCDSVIHQTVIVHPNLQTTLDTTVCAAELPYTWYGHTFAAAGSHTATLVAVTGADSTVTYNLSVDNITATVENVTHVTCFGSSTGSATAAVTGGQAPLTYVWTDAAGGSLSATTSVSNSPAGTYTFTVTDQLGCAATANVTLNTLNGALVAGTIGSDQGACAGENLAPFTGSAASGGDNGTYQWQISTDGETWTNAPGAGNGQDYAYPDPTTTGFLLRRAWVSQSCGTVYSDTVTVEIWLSSYDTVSAEVCMGDPYTDNSFDITPEQYGEAGDYVYEEHFSNGHCDSVVVLLLAVRPLYEQSFEDEICEGDGYNSHGFAISRQETVGVDSIRRDKFLQTVNGCDSVVHLRLSVIDTALRIVPLTQDFCEEMTMELMVVTPMVDYVWSTGEESPTITVTAPGLYSVMATEGGCSVAASYWVERCLVELYLPNAISPSNSDGLNDWFSIPESNRNDMVMFEISFFNRWGELVYYSTDKNFRWNGEYRGVIHHETVYNYVIRYTDTSGRPYRVAGSLTVL